MKYKRNLIKQGDVFTTNQGTCEVVQYVSAHDVRVVWLEDPTYVMSTHSCQLKRGSVGNPFYKSVVSVGYIGVGQYKPVRAGKMCREYVNWTLMLNRCYNSAISAVRPNYKDVVVCDHWHNFQNFADWCQTQPGFGVKGWHLDKDILIAGNKVYGPATCCFVPHYLNSVVSQNLAIRGQYPIGVCWDESKKKFSSSISNYSHVVKLGVFTNPLDAFLIYKKAKEAYVRVLAEDLYGVIGNNVYQALMNYCVEERT